MRGNPHHIEKEILFDEYRRKIDRKSTMINAKRNSTDRFTYSYTPGLTGVGIDIECPDCYDGIWNLDYKMETPAFTGTEFSHEYYEIYADYSFDGNVITREKREGRLQE